MEKLEVFDFFKTSEDLFAEAKEGIKGNKGSSLAINFIFWLSKLCFFAAITLGVILIFNINNFNFNKILFLILILVFLMISIFTYGPLKVSVCKNAMNMVENTNPSFKDINFGFKHKYGRNMFYGLCLVFIYLFNLILLIIPFINKYIHYQIAGYVLASDDNISTMSALKLSTQLSKGFNKKYLKIFVKFIPHFLLCLPTAYIYSLWCRPKYNTVMYCYYRDIKA